jgi:hypothetical protein
VEGSDSFDAISRSFSYVFARPWRTLFYSAVALAYGALTYLFVRLFIAVMLMLAHGSIGWFLGKNHQANHQWDGVPVANVAGAHQAYDTSKSIWPAPRYDALTYDVPFGNLNVSQDIAASLIAFWVYLTISLLGAYLISFYLSANTIIYYLLRREVDATDLDDVYVEQADEDFSDASVESPTPSSATAPTATPAGAVGSPEPTGAGATSSVRVYDAPSAPSSPPPSSDSAATPASELPPTDPPRA